MTNSPLSNLKLLKSEFSDIIQSEKDFDHQGKSSSLTSQRKTFTFTDGSSLSIAEIAKNGKIDFYYYEWVKNKKIFN